MPSPRVIRLVFVTACALLVGAVFIVPYFYEGSLVEECDEYGVNGGDGQEDCEGTRPLDGPAPAPSGASNPPPGAAPAPAPAPAAGGPAPAPGIQSCNRSCDDQGCGCICTNDCGGNGPPGMCCPSACGPIRCEPGPNECEGDPPSDREPQCGQCIPSSCVCSANGWLCSNDCKPQPPECASSSAGSSQSSQASSQSNSSSGTNGPAPAPAPAPGSSSAGSSTSSQSSSASSGGFVDCAICTRCMQDGNCTPAECAALSNQFGSGTCEMPTPGVCVSMNPQCQGSSSSAPGPAPAPPVGCTPDMRACAGGCLPGTMPAKWEFTVSDIEGGIACSDGDCAAAAGTFTVTMDSEDVGFSCELTKEITPAVCSAQVNPSEWKLTVTEPRQAPNGEMYTASLGLGNSVPVYYHFGAWNCNAPNIFELILSPGAACAPFDEQVIVSPVSSCVSSSSSSSRSSTTSSTSSAASSQASSLSSATSSTGQSSSSSSAVSTSCDGLVCFLGGLANCQQQGFSICTATDNPPSCHTCSNPAASSSSAAFRSTGSSASSVTGFTNSSARSSVGTASSARSSAAARSSAPTTAVTSSSSAPATGPRCGDNVVQASRGEVCDDGVESATCTSQCLLALGQSCTLNAQCGSGRCIQGRCLGSCKADVDCPEGLICGDKGLCTIPTCGDGKVTEFIGETCDLGSTCTSDPASCNRAPGTAGVECLCDPADKNCPHKPEITWIRGCVSPPGLCGNGVLDTNTEVFLNGTSVNGALRREQCDLGESNGVPGSPCSKECTLILTPFCGNGELDAGEACDEGVRNGTPDSRCTSLCGFTLPANTAAGNEFDSPNLTPGHQSASYELPLLPVRVPGSTSADLTRLSTSRPPVAQTGPEALLAIAMGAGLGWTVMRRRRK